jgi:hypothetical protein
MDQTACPGLPGQDRWAPGVLKEVLDVLSNGRLMAMIEQGDPLAEHDDLSDADGAFAEGLARGRAPRAPRALRPLPHITGQIRMAYFRLLCHILICDVRRMG